MANPVVTILDTTIGETGNEYITDLTFLKEDQPVRITCDIGSGDTIVIQGRAEDGDAWQTLHEFTEDGAIDLYLSMRWRVTRTVDGGSDTILKVENRFNQDWEDHA